MGKQYDSDIVGWYTRNGKKIPIRKGDKKSAGSDTSSKKKKMEADEVKDMLEKDNAETRKKLKARGIYFSEKDLPEFEVGKKVRVSIGEYSSENPMRWGIEEMFVNADKIIDGKDGFIRIFNDGMETILPEGYAIEDMNRKYHYFGSYQNRKYDTRVRKDGLYYYPTFPSRKKDK